MNTSTNKSKHLLADSGRRVYAFGLPWFSADEEEPTRKQALNLIKKSQKNYDLIGIRGGDFPQYTVGSTEDGLKGGVISAASIVAEMMGTDNWLYVAEIDGSFWITHGRDNLIMPEGDVVFENEADALAEFEDLNPTNYKSVSIPAKWKEQYHNRSGEGTALITSDIEISELSDIFQKPSKTTARLNAVSSLGTIIRAAVLLALVGGLGYGAYALFFTGGTQGMTQAEIDAMLEAERRRQANQLQAAYDQLDSNRPWELLPNTNAFIETCLDQIGQMPLQPAGYQLSQVQCTGSQVFGTYMREESYPRWLNEWKDQPRNSEYNLSVDIETSNATITKNFDGPAARGPDNLASFLEVAEKLRDADLLISGEMTYTQPVQFTVPDYPEYQPMFGTSSLAITTTQPEQWSTELNTLPGITISNVTLDLTTMEYTINGTVHVATRQQ
jgi:hypothetical protein